MIAVEPKPTGLNKIFPVTKSLDTFIWVDVPIPTDKLGSTRNVIESPVSNSWGSVVVIVVSILSVFEVTSSKTVSNRYLSRKSSLIDGTVIKWTSEKLVPIPVLIPIELIPLLTANKVSGKLNVEIPLSADIAIFCPAPPVGVENLILWFVLKGWFSIWICFTGTFLVIFWPAKGNVNVFSDPSSVPNPTVCDGLKNIFSFKLLSYYGIDSLIVNLFDR